MTVKEGTTVYDIPHELRVEGCKVLVVVPGRAPLCLRCRKTGHIRRSCRVPRCTECHRYGHVGQDCARTFAAIVRERRTEEPNDLMMDEMEAEDAAASGAPAAQTGTEPGQPGTLADHDGTATTSLGLHEPSTATIVTTEKPTLQPGGHRETAERAATAVEQADSTDDAHGETGQWCVQGPKKSRTTVPPRTPSKERRGKDSIQLPDGGATPTPAKRHLSESSSDEFAHTTSMLQDDEGAMDGSVLGSKEDGDFTTDNRKKKRTRHEAQKCVNCQRAHEATSTECPKLQKKKETCKVKVRENITFLEAAKVVEEQRKIKRRNNQHVEKPGAGTSQPKSQTTAQGVDPGAQGSSSPAGAAKAYNLHSNGRDNHGRGLTYRDVTQGTPPNPAADKKKPRYHPETQGIQSKQGTSVPESAERSTASKFISLVFNTVRRLLELLPPSEFRTTLNSLLFLEGLLGAVF
ncbi:hypothetical protein ISCGN_001358 [Ixodes scapularis]